MIERAPRRELPIERISRLVNRLHKKDRNLERARISILTVELPGEEAYPQLRMRAVHSTVPNPIEIREPVTGERIKSTHLVTIDPAIPGDVDVSTVTLPLFELYIDENGDVRIHEDTGLRDAELGDEPDRRITREELLEKMRLIEGVTRGKPARSVRRLGSEQLYPDVKIQNKFKRLIESIAHEETQLGSAIWLDDDWDGADLMVCTQSTKSGIQQIDIELSAPLDSGDLKLVKTFTFLSDSVYVGYKEHLSLRVSKVLKAYADMDYAQYKEYLEGLKAQQRAHSESFKERGQGGMAPATQDELKEVEEALLKGRSIIKEVPRVI